MSETSKQTSGTEGKPGDIGSNRPRVLAAAVARAADEARAEAGSPARMLGDVARHVVEQGQAAAQTRVGAMAGAQASMAESSFLQGQHAIEVAAQVTRLYHEAAEHTAEDLQALTASSIQLTRGVLQWQHTWFEMLQRTLDDLGKKPQTSLNCSSFEEMAQIQHDVCLDMTRRMLTSSTTLLQLASQVAQDALRPLQQRAQRAA